MRPAAGVNDGAFVLVYTKFAVICVLQYSSCCANCGLGGAHNSLHPFHTCKHPSSLYCRATPSRKKLMLFLVCFVCGVDTISSLTHEKNLQRGFSLTQTIGCENTCTLSGEAVRFLPSPSPLLRTALRFPPHSPFEGPTTIRQVRVRRPGPDRGKRKDLGFFRESGGREESRPLGLGQ